MSLGYIPLSEIIQYAMVLGYADHESLERFIYFIQGMDEVYVECRGSQK